MTDVDRILRLNTVLARTGPSRTTPYRKIREGAFQARVRISLNGAGWRESAINRRLSDMAAFHAYESQISAPSTPTL